MNANAYGGELARVLEWVDVVSAGGNRPPGTRTQLGFAYRRSSLAPGEVVARASFALDAAASDGGQGDARRHARAAARPRSRRGSRRSARRSRTRTIPRAEGRTAGQLLDAAGCRGLRIGGAGFSAKHANFVENHGDATTADVVAVMAEGRRRVKERFGIELEPEVQTLGPVEFPADWRRAMIAEALASRASVAGGRGARIACSADG